MPLITDEWINSLYERLSKLDVQLDPNPLELGPGSMNNKHSELRTAISSLEKISLEVLHNLHSFKRELTSQKLNYSLEQTRLMASDPQVKVGRSQAEREALAATKLTRFIIAINELDLAVQDLEAADKVIKGKRNDLKNLQATLKDQFRLCQEQINLGGRWGRSAPSTSFQRPSQPSSSGDAEMINWDEMDSPEVVQTNEDLKGLFDTFIDEVSHASSPLFERKAMPQIGSPVVLAPEVAPAPVSSSLEEEQPKAEAVTVAIVSDLETLFKMTAVKDYSPSSLLKKTNSTKDEIEEFLATKPVFDEPTKAIEEDLSELFDFFK